ncbi:MAG: M14 family metallopeptidase [Xanthomonadales bacterium]|jgi:hypothetical protein|nr:M14 family metallopeptidase [Xanthomonadales bacterium]
MKLAHIFSVLAALMGSASTLAQPTTLPHPADFVWFEGADPDPTVPDGRDVLGHAIGEDLALSADIRRYFEALAAARPAQVKLTDYGQSWEGRALWYATIGSGANLARLEQIRGAMQRLADPRGLDAAEAERLIAQTPAIVWLGYSVHGNEPGTSEAAMLTAWHLLASRGDARVAKMLEETVVVIVPVQNPDGRDRFIHAERATRGPFPDADPYAAGRVEPWPGGRMNHYVFDLNRDWFAQTQPETRLQVPELLKHHPVVVVDVHEMGSGMSYFFPPEAEPFNPYLTATQLGLAGRIGENNARWLDRYGKAYFTREIFDAFYPGYGSGWPNYQGYTAMVYEQGSSRGLVVQRKDGSLLTFRETVQSQFLTGLSAIEVVANDRPRALRDFHEYRKSAVEEGRRGPVRAYLIPPQADQAGVELLARRLLMNGIEVQRAEDEVRGCEGPAPAGSYVVDVAQPASRLLRTLMEPVTTMDPDFVERQQVRLDRGLPAEIYDVTAWSLPLMANLEVRRCKSLPDGGLAAFTDTAPPQGRLSADSAQVAWLVRWGDAAATRFLAAAHRAGLDVRASDRAFRHGGREFPAGSLIVPVRGNPPDLRAQLAVLARDSGATVHAADRGRSESGPDFGSPGVRDLPAPRIALLWDEPAERYSAGWARYAIERGMGYPVTLLRGRLLAGVDLSRYDVLVLPAEGVPYAQSLGPAAASRLRDWVQRGGVLVGLSTAMRWLADPAVDLVGVRREDAAAEPGSAPSAAPSGLASSAAPASTVPGSRLANLDALAAATAPTRRTPASVSGALVRAEPDTEHWLAAGLAPRLNVLVVGPDIYAPLRRDLGGTVVRFAAPDDLAASGVLWGDNQSQLAYKPVVIAQPLGAGWVIGFTQDPNTRGYLDGLATLFANALFRSPARAGTEPYAER